jgi:MFS family permease
VLAVLLALLAHRAGYGISLLITLVLMRAGLGGGMLGLGQVAIAAGAGILLAGVTTDRVVDRIGRRGTVCAALGLAAVTQLGLGMPMLLWTIVLASFLLTFAGQVVKLCVDAAVQGEVGDEVRGRVFALYDTLFNATQVVALTVAAAVIPTDGRSPGLLIAATATYLLGLCGYLLLLRRRSAAHASSVATSSGQR